MLLCRRSLLTLLLCGWLSAAFAQEDNQPPEGFRALFNGQDVSGWYGLNTDPRKLKDMSQDELDAMRQASLEDVNNHWTVENGELVNDGEGLYLTTVDEFSDYELWIDYKTVPKADSGIYLKATPQVQIWDSTNQATFGIGSDKGSGGLWNNSAGTPGKDPLVMADKEFGQWNRFRIRQLGARTWVWLNEQLVVDNAIMENYWERESPLFFKGPIQLQTHGGEIRWRNIFVREIPAEEANRLLSEQTEDGFVSIFDGESLKGWAGPVDNYEVQDGALTCKPRRGGTIFTEDTYDDFVVRLEFKLPPSGNNGLAIRYPGEGDPAYVAMCELQVLDSEHSNYANLDARQYHGSAYGMVAAKRGYLRPTGQWNYQETTVKGSAIRVELNGTVILDADLSQVNEFLSNSPHPGKDRAEGHFGLAGHGDAVEFRNIRIQRIEP